VGKGLKKLAKGPHIFKKAGHAMINQAKIFSLMVAPDAGQYLVTLEEIKGTRLLPVWIGPAEGMAIAAALGRHDFPRPLTHDLIVSMLRRMQVKVSKVVITDISQNTFYAKLVLNFDGNTYEIDSRPSDSIAIALRSSSPIYIEESVFKKCPKIEKPISKEEVEVFRSKLKDLKPEDFFSKTEDKKNRDKDAGNRQ
jgi:hypothetical protein